jgi:hypothetical protein
MHYSFRLYEKFSVPLKAAVIVISSLGVYFGKTVSSLWLTLQSEGMRYYTWNLFHFQLGKMLRKGGGNVFETIRQNKSPISVYVLQRYGGGNVFETIRQNKSPISVYVLQRYTSTSFLTKVIAPVPYIPRRGRCTLFQQSAPSYWQRTGRLYYLNTTHYLNYI